MDEQTKQALLIAILVFNLVVILFQVLFNGFLGGIIVSEFSWPRLFIGILVGAALGGGIFAVVRKR